MCVAKAVLRRKFIALNAYTRKEEMSKISYLSYCLMKLERKEEIKPKEYRRKY